MSDAKIQPNDSDVDAFLASVDNEKRRTDAKTVIDMMTRITGWQARMWGKTMVGFGAYDYVYESGHSGRAMMVGLSPRKGSLAIYIMPGFKPFVELMAKLGKHKTGKSCLYVNKLEDIDLAVLEDLIAGSVDIMKDRHSWAEA